MTLEPDAIGLVCDDLLRTLAFSRDLGLDVPAESECDRTAHRGRVPGGFSLMFDPVETVQSFDKEWAAPTGSPRTSLAFACGSPAEVDKTYASMVAAGWDGHLEPWDAFWGQRYATLRDPDGTGVDLYAPLPTT